ncbi:MAG: hypothetical protein F7B78_07240 [Desulfurococcales archaeon]|nr:hypothetical protein [Desulfurococcales archaeon]
MKYSKTIVPDWTVYSSLNPKEIISIPGLQQILLLNGIRKVEDNELPSVDWICCGIYKVSVNGGGSESEIPIEPSLQYYEEPVPRFDPWTELERLAEWLGYEVGNYYVNPLSWLPLTPITISNTDEGPAGCVYDEDMDTMIIGSMPPPLRTSSITKCKRSKHRRPSEALINGFKLSTAAKELNKDLSYISSEDCHGYFHNGSIYIEGKCSLEIDSPYYDHKVSILYPGMHYDMRIGVAGRSIGPVPAVSIGLWNKISLASRTGIILDVKPGKIVVQVNGSLRIASGGSKTSYRILIEDLVEWRPIRAPEPGFGNIRSSSAAIVFVGWDEPKIVFSIYNPIHESGIADLRLPYDGRNCTIIGPLGPDDIPVSGDLVRIPVPAGFVGVAEISLTETRLFHKFRIRKRFRSQ